jgi:hypothetical protein
MVCLDIFGGGVLTNLCLVCSCESQIYIHVSRFVVHLRVLSQYRCNVQVKKVQVFELVIIDLLNKVEEIVMINIDESFHKFSLKT